VEDTVRCWRGRSTHWCYVAMQARSLDIRKHHQATQLQPAASSTILTLRALASLLLASRDQHTNDAIPRRPLRSGTRAVAPVASRDVDAVDHTQLLE
jgi:hypothetical protein